MKIAWFTPFSVRSAIGEFSRHVVNELARTVGVDLWIVDDDELHPSHVRQRLATEAAAQPFLLNDRTVVYNFGDYLPFHQPIAAVAAQCPGVAILHDRSYQNLFGARWRLGQGGEYVRKMTAYYGADGQRHALQSLDGSGEPVWSNEELARRFPLIEEALIRAEGAVAHSADHADEIRARWGGPVAGLFLPTYPTDWVERKLSPSDRSDNRHVLLTVGHVNRNKQIDVLIELLGLRPDLASRIRYVVLGPYEERGLYFRRLRELIERYSLAETVQLLGYQADEVFTSWMGSADVFINLRHPNLEGGSASLMRQRRLRHASGRRGGQGATLRPR
jgi:glycosyltransferase involved in cell wall biosynthesis